MRFMQAPILASKSLKIETHPNKSKRSAIMKRVYLLVVVCLCLLLAVGIAVADDKKLKAGFVYVGDVGDFGWTNAHDVGRKYAEKKLPWLETVYIESVSEADSIRIIDRLIQQEKCDVVFTTSFGYMDDTIKAGKRYPKNHFMHCSGFKQIENVGTYFADLVSNILFERIDGRRHAVKQIKSVTWEHFLFLKWCVTSMHLPWV